MPTVCLDFDDTLCGADDAPLPGVGPALAELRRREVRLVLSSARFSPIYGELNAKRAEKVQAWLDRHGLQVDAMAIRVPAADLYVDDRAWRWSDWEADLPPLRDLVYPGWREHRAGRRGRGTLSVSFDALWREGAPAPGAPAALAELARLDVPVSVCAIEAGAPPRELRDRLRGAGLEVGRVETGKVGAEAYLNPRGYRFTGDWQAALPEVLAHLGF